MVLLTRKKDVRATVDFQFRFRYLFVWLVILITARMNLLSGGSGEHLEFWQSLCLWFIRYSSVKEHSQNSRSLQFVVAFLRIINLISSLFFFFYCSDFEFLFAIFCVGGHQFGVIGDSESEKKADSSFSYSTYEGLIGSGGEFLM